MFWKNIFAPISGPENKPSKKLIWSRLQGKIYWLLAWSVFQPWRWRRHNLLKCWLTFNEMYEQVQGFRLMQHCLNSWNISEDGRTTKTCSGYWIKIVNNYSNSVTLDGNPESDLVHGTGCKQPSLRNVWCYIPGDRTIHDDPRFWGAFSMIQLLS
jgi:hypothetical protein